MVAWAFAQNALTDRQRRRSPRASTPGTSSALLVLLVVLVAAAPPGWPSASPPPQRRRAPRARRRVGVALLVALALVPVARRRALALRDAAALGGRSPRAGNSSPTPTPHARPTTPNRLDAPPAASARATGTRRCRSSSDNPRRRRRRRRLRDRPHALPHRRRRRPPRPRLRRPDARRPRPRRARASRCSRCSPRGWPPPRARSACAGATAALPWDRRAHRRCRRSAVVVLVFGVHSSIDWTWFVPGNARPRAALRRLGRRPRPARATRARAAPAHAGARRAARAPAGRRRRLEPAGALGGRRAGRCSRSPRLVGLPAGPLALHASNAALDRLDAGAPAAAADIARIARPAQPAVGRPAVRPRRDRAGARAHGPGAGRARARGAPAARQRRAVAAPGELPLVGAQRPARRAATPSRPPTSSIPQSPQTSSDLLQARARWRPPSGSRARLARGGRAGRRPSRRPAPGSKRALRERRAPASGG